MPGVGSLSDRTFEVKIKPAEPTVMIPHNVAEIIRQHVTLEVEGIDRPYLNGYVLGRRRVRPLRAPAIGLSHRIYDAGGSAVERR